MRRTIVVYVAVLVAFAVVGWVRLGQLRGASASAPARAPAKDDAVPRSPAGPPLAGTDVPLPAVLERHRTRLEKHLAPAARLRPGGEPVARLGGQPRLPAGLAWPASPSRPMSFVAELDLAALHRAAPKAAPALPREGRLLLFYDVEELRGGYERGDGAFFRLLHLKDAGRPRPAPKGAMVFPERILGAQAARVLPDEEGLGGGKALGERAAEAYSELALALAPEPDHRVGGHPAWIQSDDREYAAVAAIGGSMATPEQAQASRARLAPGAAAEWNLLWQFDSDDEAGFMWGDVGRLYLLARDADVRAGRFDRAWLIMQCY